MAKAAPKSAKKVTKKAAPVKKAPVEAASHKAGKSPVAQAVLPTAKILKSSVIVSTLDTKGKVSGELKLSAAMFAAPTNAQLIAQAVRVYLANQRVGTALTQTRGKVEGSTRKIYRQKGT